MLWAIKIRYLNSPITSDGKWHTKTTKWYTNSADAWEEADKFSNPHSYEEKRTLIHK